MRKFNKVFNLKIIALIASIIFLCNTTIYSYPIQKETLRILSPFKNPEYKRRIYGALLNRRIIYADSEDAKNLLEVNNADALLLSGGKYLVLKEVADNELRLIKAVTHEDIEALMQIIDKEDRTRHLAIKELILIQKKVLETYYNLFPRRKRSGLPTDLLINDIIAKAFELMFILDEGMASRGELAHGEIAFIECIRPVIVSNKHSYFSEEFWDSKIRGEMIRDALNRGTVFYQMAETRQDSFHVNIDRYEQKRAEEKYGKNIILTDVEIQGFDLETNTGFQENHYEKLKELLTKLRQITSPPNTTWRLIITTNSVLTEGEIAAINLRQKISRDYPINSVFLHVHFFEHSKAVYEFSPYPQFIYIDPEIDQLKILHEFLISHIARGIIDEGLAIKDTQQIIDGLDKVCQIMLNRHVDWSLEPPDDDVMSPGFRWDSDSRIKQNEVRNFIFRSLASLTTNNPDEKVKIIKFMDRIRSHIVERNSILDNVLIEQLSEIAENLPDPDTFMDALFIEQSFCKIFLYEAVISKYEWYCRDYGSTLTHGIFKSNAISKTVFSIYKELFTNSDTLRSFVRSFAKTLREDPSLADKLKDEAKLRAYLSSLAKPAASLKKCLVLDCDGVLWKGIIGEDGLDGIEVTPGHIEFQKAIKALKEKGIILAINSKNNPKDVEGALRDHPDMVLREGDFAIIKANWQDKATNIKEIVSELNIGIDSLVFLDDSAHERELIRMSFPEILTPDFSEDPSRQLKSLVDSGIFSEGTVTEEDKRRTELYKDKTKRDELKEAAVSLEDYYRSLEMKVIIREGDQNFKYVPRIAQMTQRTNQFNLTTKTYEEKDIMSFLQDPSNYRVYTLELSDKLGDAGIVGSIILKKEKDYAWAIDSFCLSCRAVRLTVEDAFIAHVVEDLKRMNASSLKGVYKQTERNALVKDLYKEFGFEGIDEGKWKLDLKQKHLNAPDWIVVTATERKVRKSRVPKAYEPVLDIFYSFLDECNSKVLYKEETVAAMKAWLNAVEKNNIKISIKDIEFLIKLSPGWAEKRWDTDQVLGSLCDILENDSALLTIESVPDLRKINTTRKAPLGKPYTVRALCDRIYDICDSIFRSPYYTIVLYSKDMYTGGLDSDSEYIYEHVVDYYKLESTLPTSKAPSLISTLREIYNYHLASGLDEISALRSTEEWLDEFYYRTVNKASPVSYRGLHPTQAFYLLHWKERLENRLYIGKEGVIIKTASEEIIPGLPHALLVHKDVHSPLDKTTQLSIEVLRGYFRWEDRPAIDVLDMGCGTGVLSLLAAQLMDAGSITAVDNNEKAIELTRSNIERFGLSERIELKQGDLFENLRGRRFDLIIFNPPGWWSGRYHTTERFLKELHEHLKDGGEARITWPIEFWRSPSEEEPATTEDDLKKLAKQYGLDVETIGREGPYGAYRITVSQETNVQSRTSSGNGIRKTTNSSL